VADLVPSGNPCFGGPAAATALLGAEALDGVEVLGMPAGLFFLIGGNFRFLAVGGGEVSRGGEGLRVAEKSGEEGASPASSSLRGFARDLFEPTIERGSEVSALAFEEGGLRPSLTADAGTLAVPLPFIALPDVFVLALFVCRLCSASKSSSPSMAALAIVVSSSKVYSSSVSCSEVARFLFGGGAESGVAFLALLGRVSKEIDGRECDWCRNRESGSLAISSDSGSELSCVGLGMSESSV
jgi:hypothetical protein